MPARQRRWILSGQSRRFFKRLPRLTEFQSGSPPSNVPLSLRRVPRVLRPPLWKNQPCADGIHIIGTMCEHESPGKLSYVYDAEPLPSGRQRRFTSMEQGAELDF